MNGSHPPTMLIVGLGNPGPRYRDTRHNIGAEVVERLAQRLKLRLKLTAAQTAWIASDNQVVLAQPNTFMNESGPAVAQLTGAFKACTPLIVSDDLDLPLGTIRFRTKGSAGGHRGLASIIAALGTEEFPRLRIGIGRPAGQEDACDYVLNGFTGEERDIQEVTLNRAAEALHLAVSQGLAQAMTAFSQ